MQISPVSHFNYRNNIQQQKTKTNVQQQPSFGTIGNYHPVGFDPYTYSGIPRPTGSNSNQSSKPEQTPSSEQTQKPEQTQKQEIHVNFNPYGSKETMIKQVMEQYGVSREEAEAAVQAAANRYSGIA